MNVYILKSVKGGWKIIGIGRKELDLGKVYQHFGEAQMALCRMNTAWALCG